MIAVITSCSKAKNEFCGPAWLVNRGQLLRLVNDYANLIHADLFILSAKYGLIHGDMKIAPYDMKLRKKSDILRISDQSNEKLKVLIANYDQIIIIMGRFYRSVFSDLTNEKITIIDDERGIGGYYQKVVELTKEASLNYGLQSINEKMGGIS